MTIRTTSDIAGIESTASCDDIETTLKSLAPAQPSAALFEKLLNAVTLPEQEEETADDLPLMREMVPVSLSEEKIAKWGRMMDEAARATVEEKLNDLKAAPPSDFKLMRWLMSVENTSEKKANKAKKSFLSSTRRQLALWGASAAATFLLIVGVLSTGDGEKTRSNVVKTDINRETLNVVDEGVVNWDNEKSVAQKQYKVDYMDSLELVDEDGRKMRVSVPSTQIVDVPVQIY